MKVQIFDWAYECRGRIEELGYKNRQVVEFDCREKMYNLADCFVQKNLYVAIKKLNDPDIEGEAYTMYIDSRRFTQR